MCDCSRHLPGLPDRHPHHVTSKLSQGAARDRFAHARAHYRKSRGLSPSEPLPHGFTFYELSSIFPSFSRLVLVLVSVLVHRQSDTKWLATLSKLSPLVCKMTNRFHYVGSHVRWLVRFLLKWLAASHSELFPRKNSL